MRQYERADIDYDTWYSPWMKMLARSNTRRELEAMGGKSRTEADKASTSHLAAIAATSSMGGQSARRARTRNMTAGAGDQLIAINGALEIHDLFPEHAKAAW